MMKGDSPLISVLSIHPANGRVLLLCAFIYVTLLTSQRRDSELSSNLANVNNTLTSMKSNLMAINTYSMTLNTSNVKTPDSWIECNRIGNLVMINGCAKITKAVNTYSIFNIASGAPVPCCNKQLYTVAIAQDNTYSNCFLEVSKSGAVNLLVRWQKASSGDIFYYEFCYICK